MVILGHKTELGMEPSLCVFNRMTSYIRVVRRVLEPPHCSVWGAAPKQELHDVWH